VHLAPVATKLAIAAVIMFFPILTVTLAITALGLLARGYLVLRSTTLVGPWYWACFVLTAVAACESWIALAANSGSWQQAVRYAVVVGVCCPHMAVLGAKRPQHRGWSMIVVSLWGLLAMPAAETAIFRPAEALHVAPLWRWLLAGLILLGLLNYLGTRFVPSALLVSAAQVLVLKPFLPGELYLAGDLLGIAPQQRTAGGLLLAIAAIAGVQLGWPRRRAGATAVDRLWLDFRDRWGVFWALRVGERVAKEMAAAGLPVVLSWRGFLPSQGDSMSAEQAARLERVLRSCLLRFASDRWIAEHLSET